MFLQSVILQGAGRDAVLGAGQAYQEEGRPFGEISVEGTVRAEMTMGGEWGLPSKSGTSWKTTNKLP